MNDIVYQTSHFYRRDKGCLSKPYFCDESDDDDDRDLDNRYDHVT